MNHELNKQGVRQMFDRIAPTYDKLNHLMSLGIDRRWRRTAVDALGKHKPQHILDIATGTGDFALLMADRIKPQHIIGADISEGMMAVGREKVKEAGLQDTISFQKEDCMKLSFPDGTFDAVTSAYGVRNFLDLDKGLREMLRVLRPGGHLLIVELTPPPCFPMKQLFWLYAHVVMPLLGRIISHDDSAYTYLPASMEAFPQAEEMEGILKRAGFAEVQWKRFTFGISTMYLCRKMKNEEFATALSASSSTSTSSSTSSTSTPHRGGVREGLEGSLFGLIGFPLGHSFSKGYFTEKFAREGIDAQYLNFEIPDATMLFDVLRENPELRGLNVTLPHKQAVIPLLDELSDEAREIGAVNVIKIDPPQPSLKGREKSDVAGHRSLPLREGWGGSLKGFNSDIIGFMESIKPLLQPWHKKALVLGTGGASKAICVGLKRLGIEWRYVSRNGGQGARSKEQENTSCPNNPLAPCPLPLAPLNYSDLTPEVMAEYTVIVNCSPVGMFPKVDAAPAIPYELLTPRHLLFDCVYNPEDTLFLKRGREQGATGKNGLEMLHLQAEASWKFWNE